MSDNIELYKFLNVDGSPCTKGTGTYALPRGDRPGKWMPVQTPVVLCARGYHGCRAEHLLEWLGPTLWLMEGRGEIVEARNKVACSEARIVRRVETYTERPLRLFAADCAERVLWRFEAERPGDSRPRLAIEAARAYVGGEIGRDELAAAGDAAWDAPRDTAWAASRDVAWDTAWDAAWAAAWAAWGAVRGVAWDAARDTAWAAGDAERGWQQQHLVEMLGLDV